MQLARTTIATPLGEMLALASDAGLCALEFVEVRKRSGPVRDAAAGQARLTRLNARLRRWFPPHEIVDTDTGTFARTRAWLATYFGGAGADLGDLPLDMHGAGFEKRVWQALLEIPAGQTMSYGAIAKQLGSAGASRAVGAANGANPIAIIVPCHRVIGSNGSLTGYGGGLDRKTWLLDHERRWRGDTLF
jgi:O-6-methylguanine DNA methyltransferase